jgi:hypothetical protein
VHGCQLLDTTRPPRQCPWAPPVGVFCPAGFCASRGRRPRGRQLPRPSPALCPPRIADTECTRSGPAASPPDTHAHAWSPADGAHSHAQNVHARDVRKWVIGRPVRTFSNCASTCCTLGRTPIGAHVTPPCASPCPHIFSTGRRCRSAAGSLRRKLSTACTSSSDSPPVRPTVEKVSCRVRASAANGNARH